MDGLDRLNDVNVRWETDEKVDRFQLRQPITHINTSDTSESARLTLLTTFTSTTNTNSNGAFDGRSMFRNNTHLFRQLERRLAFEYLRELKPDHDLLTWLSGFDQQGNWSTRNVNPTPERQLASAKRQQRITKQAQQELGLHEESSVSGNIAAILGDQQEAATFVQSFKRRKTGAHYPHNESHFTGFSSGPGAQNILAITSMTNI